MPAYRRIAPKPAEVSRPSWPHQWTREERVDLDGVIYDICVAKHRDEFLAVSVCNECCEQVSINLGSSSAKKGSGPSGRGPAAPPGFRSPPPPKARLAKPKPRP